MSDAARPVALFVINSLAGGGAERVFTTLLSHGQAFHDLFRVIVVLLDDEPVEAYALPDWVEVVRLDCRMSLWRSIRRLSALIVRLRPVVAASFLTRANVATVLGMRQIRARTVISERVNTSAHLSGGRLAVVSRWLVRRTYPKADRVVAVSAGVGQTLIDDFGVTADRIVVIDNPVDVVAIRMAGEQLDPLGVTAQDWVTMGRLTANKNTALAIRAVAASGLPGRLFVLGQGPLADTLVALAAELGIGDRVHFAGFQSNPYASIARAAGYLLPSNAEGFPNALVEAMALGVPVVATDCPSGPAEILGVKNGVTAATIGQGGILVPMEDVGLMATAMTLLVDPERRERLSLAASQRVKQFSIERATTRFVEVIKSAIAQ